MIPVTFYAVRANAPLPESSADTAVRFTQTVRLLIGAGITGILVNAEVTQLGKKTIRETSIAECRQELPDPIASEL